MWFFPGPMRYLELLFSHYFSILILTGNAFRTVSAANEGTIMNHFSILYRIRRAARALRAFARPVLLLLAVCVCAGTVIPTAAGESGAAARYGVNSANGIRIITYEPAGPQLGESAAVYAWTRQSEASACGTLQVNFFHDRNANNIPEPDELIVPLPDGSLELDDGQIIDVTFFEAPVNRNLGMSSLPAGDWSVASVTPPDGYRITDSLGVQPTLTSGYDLLSYADSPSFYVGDGEVAALYIPVLADPPRAVVAGSVLYNENASAAAGATVELLGEAGQPLPEPPPLQIIGDTGAYSFGELTPGLYRIRTTAPANDTSVQYAPQSTLSSVLTVLDGEAYTMDFGFSRAAQVYFYLDARLVHTYSDIRYGSLISSPGINSSYLTLSNGTKRIDGWYRDAAFTQQWNFAADAVTENLSLYAKWTYVANTSSSGSDYKWGTPKIQSAKATLSDNNTSVLLSVRMAGETYTDDDGYKDDMEFDYTYLWQKKDQFGYWDDIYEGDRTKYTYSSVSPGTFHQFQVVVTREDDGKTVTSNTLTVNVPSSTDTSAGQQQSTSPLPDSGLPYSTGGGNTSPTGGTMSALPDLGGDAAAGDGEIELMLSDAPIYKGGRVEITPAQPGGDWGWDDTLLSMDSPGVFTALDIGSANVVYNYNGSSVMKTIEILPARLPATGQSVTPILLTGSAGICAWLGALWLRLRRRKEEQHAS